MEREQKTRLSGVDWAIILITVLLAAGGLFLAYRSLVGTQSTMPISYRLCLSDLSDGEDSVSWRNRLITGAHVYSENGTAFLGTVTAIEVREHKEAVLLEEEFKTVTVSGRVDVYVTVEADATLQAGNGFRISDIRIAAGGIGAFRIGSYYAKNARISSVKAVAA